MMNDEFSRENYNSIPFSKACIFEGNREIKKTRWRYRINYKSLKHIEHARCWMCRVVQSSQSDSNEDELKAKQRRRIKRGKTIERHGNGDVFVFCSIWRDDFFDGVRVSVLARFDLIDELLKVVSYSISTPIPLRTHIHTNLLHFHPRLRSGVVVGVFLVVHEF